MTGSGTIDYWDIVIGSLKVVWRNKSLWFFGFFASAGAGGSIMNWTEEGGPSVAEFLRSRLELLAIIILGLIILWLLLFVMSLISRGALIGGSARASDGTRVTFGDAWARGLETFWKMLVLLIIAVVIFLAVSAICAVPVVLPLAAGAPGITISIVIGAVLLLPYLAFLFLLAFSITYAEREAVVMDSGILDSLKVGWEITKDFFLNSLLVWLINLLSSLAFVIGLLIVGLVLAVPFVIIGLVSPFAGLLLGIPVGVIYLCVAMGAFGTYEYALWTLAYLELRRLRYGATASPDPGPPSQVLGAALSS